MDTASYVPTLGLFLVGGAVAIALADTKAAPIVVAFLAAAAIYNVNTIANKLTGSNIGHGVAPSPFDPNNNRVTRGPS